MFGILNPTKLLVTIAIVVAIWYGFKWLGKLGEEKRARVARRGASSGGAAPSQRRAESDAAPTEEMIRCAVCGDYVSSSRAVSCGRADCPYP